MLLVLRGTGGGGAAILLDRVMSSCEKGCEGRVGRPESGMFDDGGGGSGLLRSEGDLDNDSRDELRLGEAGLFCAESGETAISKSANDTVCGPFLDKSLPRWLAGGGGFAFFGCASLTKLECSVASALPSDLESSYDERGDSR